MIDTTQADLLHRLAHDLRSPLEVLRGTVGDLPALESKAEREHATLLAGRAVNRLLRLTEHLDLAAAASQGHLRPKPGEVDVRATVSGALARVQSAEPRSSVSVELKGEGRWKTDGKLLAAAVSELLSNALKNARSTVRIQVSTDAVAVVDDGPGVPPEKLARLFTGEHASLSGLGLGLPLANAIAEVLQLELGVSPVEPSGALSRFELRR